MPQCREPPNSPPVKPGSPRNTSWTSVEPRGRYLPGMQLLAHVLPLNGSGVGASTDTSQPHLPSNVVHACGNQRQATGVIERR
jgi:hypothetical protein